MSDVAGPLHGPLIGYDPRCTGPIPEGLTPFTPFVHSRVAVSPGLARELSERVAPGVRRVSWLRVDHLASAMVDLRPNRRWLYSPDDRVVLDERGFVVDGRVLLLAVVAADRVIELDVWHNVPGDEWALIEQGRRRQPPDVQAFRRSGPGPRRA